MSCNDSDEYEEMVKLRERMAEVKEESRKFMKLRVPVQVYLSSKNYTNDVDARLDNADLESDEVPNGLDIDPEDWPDAKLLIKAMKNQDYSGFWPDNMSSEEEEDNISNGGRKSRFDSFKDELVGRKIGSPSQAPGGKFREREGIASSSLNFEEIDDLDLFASRRLKFKKARNTDGEDRKEISLRRSKAQTDFASRRSPENLATTKGRNCTTYINTAEVKIPAKAISAPDNQQGASESYRKNLQLKGRLTACPTACNRQKQFPSKTKSFPSNQTTSAQLVNRECPSKNSCLKANDIASMKQDFQENHQGTAGSCRKSFTTKLHSVWQSDREAAEKPKPPTRLLSAWNTEAEEPSLLDAAPTQSTSQTYVWGGTVRNPGCQGVSAPGMQLPSSWSRPVMLVERAREQPLPREKTLPPVRVAPAVKPQHLDVFLPRTSSTSDSEFGSAQDIRSPNYSAQTTPRESPLPSVQQAPTHQANNNNNGEESGYQPSFFRASTERKIELEETGDFRPLPASHNVNEPRQNVGGPSDDDNRLFRKVTSVNTQKMSRHGKHKTDGKSRYKQILLTGKKESASHGETDGHVSRPHSVCATVMGKSPGHSRTNSERRQSALQPNTGFKGKSQTGCRPHTSMTDMCGSNRSGDRNGARRQDLTERAPVKRKSVFELRRQRRKDPSYVKPTLPTAFNQGHSSEMTLEVNQPTKGPNTYGACRAPSRAKSRRHKEIRETRETTVDRPVPENSPNSELRLVSVTPDRSQILYDRLISHEAFAESPQQEDIEISEDEELQDKGLNFRKRLRHYLRRRWNSLKQKVSLLNCTAHGMPTS